MSVPMVTEDVTERLGFAERRLHKLLILNGGYLPGADASDRQQLLQEFFFHWLVQQKFQKSRAVPEKGHTSNMIRMGPSSE